MQTALMFLDLNTQGMAPGIQKIAVKLPDGQVEANSSEAVKFSDVVSALMAVAPDKLQDSLEQMEWVKVEGDGCEYAPIIDLSQGQLRNQDIMTLLLEQVAGNVGQEEMTAPFEQIEVTQGKSKDSAIPTPVMKLAALINSESVQSESAQIEQNLDIFANAPPMGDTDAEDTEAIAGMNGKILHRQMARDDLAARESAAFMKPEPLQTDTETKPVGGTLEEKGDDEKAAGEQLKNKLEDLPLKDLKPLQNNEKSEKYIEQKISGPWNGEALEQKAKAFDRQETKEPVKSGTNGQITGNNQGLNRVEDTGDTEDSFRHGQHAFKESLHASSLSKNSITADKSVDHAPGDRGYAAPANDMKSDIIRQIVQRMTLRTQGTQSSMSIKLKPEFLGNVHMHISTDNHQVAVRMAAESIAVKEMIEQGLQHLRSELQHHGLEIDKFDVFVADDNHERSQGQDRAGFRQAHKRRSSRVRSASGRMAVGDEIVPKVTVERGLLNDAGEVDYFA